MRRSRTRGRFIIFALAVCALALPGCLNPPRSPFDPTGQRVFAPPPPTAPGLPAVAPAPVAMAPIARPPAARTAAYPGQPGVLPGDDVAVFIAPQRVVAPVGSEVVLVAGVRNADGYLSTNRRLEWTIARGSVGQFVAVGHNGLGDWLLGDFNDPRLVNAGFAVGSTGRRTVRLTRPALMPTGGVVLAGQGWVSVTSPVEGTSYVNVHAPEVVPWYGRMQATVIQWLDAQVAFPPPAINPAGSRHVFTTTVLRHLCPTPRVGWIVRYSISSGPPAGFGPDGVQTVEVMTNQAGQASAEIFQKQPTNGTNQVCIQVIRPVPPGGCGEPLVVRTGSVLKTWTTPDSAAPTFSGPAAGSPAVGGPKLEVAINTPPPANLGSRVTFDVVVTNRGTATAPGLWIKDRFGEGLEHAVARSPIEKPMRDLAPGESQPFGVTFRVTRPGRLCHTVEVTAADGTRASAEGCVTVLDTGGPPPGEGALPKPQPSLSVVETGPSRRNVGQTAEFSIAITNTGGQDLTNLKVVDRFDPGLTPTLASPGHQRANDDLTWTIPKLAAGETTRLTAQFECRTPSQRLCNRVTVTSQEGARGEAEACLEVRAAAPAAGPSRLTLTVFGSWNPVYAGRPVTYWVRVENKGLTAERRVRIAATVPAGLAPDATPGPLATGGPPGTSYSIEGQTIRFTPLTEIRPGDSATYYVRVRTPEAGSYTMRFELQSEDQPQPIVREESIRVLAPRSGG